MKPYWRAKKGGEKESRRATPYLPSDIPTIYEMHKGEEEGRERKIPYFNTSLARHCQPIADAVYADESL